MWREAPKRPKIGPSPGESALDSPSLTRAVAAPARPASRLGALAELTKLRLSALVVVTALTGCAAAGSTDGMLLLFVSLGTGLLAGGASAMNQLLEREFDARMDRTRDRPLPAGRISPAAALAIALALAALGFLVLARAAGLLTAGLGLLTFAVYVLIYTPLKRVTTLCTAVGAVVGAIPPVMGYTAAAGRIDGGALVLAAILFVWQVPHFLAIAWLYREDYAKSGFRMLPVVDPDGRSTFAMVLLYSLALTPVSLAAATALSTGWLYPLGALALSGWFAALAWRLYRERTREAARRLFLASLAWLPLVLGLLVLDPTAPFVAGPVR